MLDLPPNYNCIIWNTVAVCVKSAGSIQQISAVLKINNYLVQTSLVVNCNYQNIVCSFIVTILDSGVELFLIVSSLVCFIHDFTITCPLFNLALFIASCCKCLLHKSHSNILSLLQSVCVYASY